MLKLPFPKLGNCRSHSTAFIMDKAAKLFRGNRQKRKQNSPHSFHSSDDLQSRVNHLEDQLNHLHIKLAGVGVPTCRTTHQKETMEVQYGITLTARNRKSRLARLIADHVYSIVGLKEALTCAQKPFRAVWFCLLFIGAAATMFYVYKVTSEFLTREPATKVSLNREVSYEYPPVVFCPPWWFSMDDARQMNLEIEALKYSLGWLKYPGNSMEDHYLSIEPIDLADSREKFVYYYAKNNYSSLLEYFKDLSSNVTYEEGDEENCTLFTQCTACRDPKPLEKKLYNDVMCHVYQFHNATANSTTSPPGITLRNHYKADGVLKSYKKSWLMDILPNVGIDGPTVLLKPYFTYTARISVQRFIMLNSSNKTCVDTNDYPGYAQRKCVEACLRDQGPSDELNAYFSKSFVSELSYPRQPDDMPNILDLLAVARESEEINYLQYDPTGTTDCSPSNNTAGERLLATIKNNTMVYNILNETIGTVSINDTIKNVTQSGPTGKEEVDCYEKCKPACDRLIYDMTLERHRDDEDEENENQIPNISTISVYIKHAAVSQGGILTWREVDTMTFSDFVSNLGGTLGLFLGCTLMTLAQLLLSIVNVALNRRTGNGSVYKCQV